MKTTATAIAALLLAAGGARAADMPVYNEVQAPVYVAPVVFSWTGFYAGAAISYGIGRSDAETSIDLEVREETEPLDIAVGDWWSGGGLFGAQVGYNLQFGSFVVGAELAAHWSGVNGEDRITASFAGDTATAALTTDLNWLITANIKAGIAFDRALVYATGGLAYADVENGVEFDIGDTSRSWSGGGADLGFNLGLGAEYAITDSITFGLEYKHVWLGDNTVVIDEGEDFREEVNFDNDFDIVSAKINFKF